MVLDGRSYVKNEADLTEAEMETLDTLAMTPMGIGGVKDALGEKFPMRLYDSQLLHRVLKKIKDDGKLFAHGNATAANGGIWVPEICPSTMRLRATHYASPRMMMFALQCGTYFVTADGTFLTNRYRLTMVPFVTTDYLGLTHLCGLGIYPSENSPNISQPHRAPIHVFP
jgi:hypothetical protein